MSMTAEEILELGAPWTAPISDTAPSGVGAREDERYLAVVTEIAKLDSPGAERFASKDAWENVISQGGDLLREKSKDLLIASQVAYAMYRQESLKGLLKGLALLTGLIEDFWPTLFPELKRIRGRAAAVQWFLDKCEIQLKAYTPVAGDRDTIHNLLIILKRLNGSAREKYGESAPSMGSVRELVERLLFDAGPSQTATDARLLTGRGDARRESERRANAEPMLEPLPPPDGTGPDPHMERVAATAGAWAEPSGHSMKRSHGAVPLWGIQEQRAYVIVNVVQGGRDDDIFVIPLDGDALVVGMVNSASGICRGWECAFDQLIDVLNEAEAESRSCQSFADCGLC